MQVTFRSGDIIIGNDVDTLTVGLGRKFVLTISGTGQRRVRWTTENDPVLDVREAIDKLSAKVRATDLGVGHIFIYSSALDLRRITVTVVPMNDTTNEAVTLGGAIGTESPDI